MPTTTLSATTRIRRTFLKPIGAVGLVALTLGAVGVALPSETGEPPSARFSSPMGRLDVLVEGPVVSTATTVRNDDLSVLVEGPVVASALVSAQNLSVLVEGPIVSNAVH